MKMRRDEHKGRIGNNAFEYNACASVYIGVLW